MRSIGRTLVLTVTACGVLGLPVGLQATEQGAPPATITEGVTLYEAGKNDEAEAFFLGRVESGPDAAWAAYYLGRVHFRRDDPKQAIEWLERAVERDPQNSDFHHWLGRAYLGKLQDASMFAKLGLSKKVRASYLKAIELDPDNLDVRGSLAGYYFEAPSIAGGSSKKGMEQVDEIRQRDPARAHLLLASRHVDEQEYESAETEYRAALKLQPDNAPARMGLSFVYQSTERFDEAFRVLEQIIELEPDHMGAHYQIGRAASLSGKNLDRGIECFQRYLQHEPEPGAPSLAWAHYRLGLLYSQTGDAAAARREYRSALELDPDHKQAKAALRSS